MSPVRLDPVHNLLGEFAVRNLRSLARVCEVPGRLPTGRAALIEKLSRHVDVDGVVEHLPAIFPKKAPARVKTTRRLDRIVRRCGPATVQVPSRAGVQAGELFLKHRRQCLLLGLSNVPLFLENRWPVVVRVKGEVPASRLFAAFVRPGRVHPSAEAPPTATRPFLLDEGEYGLRRARFRLDLARSGPLSFKVVFLRYRPQGQAEHLLLPIA